MKSMNLVIVCLLALTLTGCAHTNDGRSGLRGEICAFGYCLTPQAMAATAVPVPETAVLSGPAIAPATVLSQPAVAVEQRTAYVQAAPVVAPAQPYYQPQLAK